MKSAITKTLATLHKKVEKQQTIVDKAYEKFAKVEQKHVNIIANFQKKIKVLEDKQLNFELKKYKLTPEQFEACKRSNSYRKYFETKMDLRGDAKRYGVEIVYDKDNVVVLKIDNYIQCRLFGSASWGLGYEKRIFDMYITNRNGMQYIVYDFNLPVSDLNCVIGFTDYPGSKKWENLAHNAKDNPVMSLITERDWYKKLAKNKFTRKVNA